MNHKHVLLQCLAALVLFAGPAQAQTDRPIRDVIVQGYGKDVADAAQNAAQNALTQVVGSFIDAEKFLAKRVEIQDGVRKETRDIRTNVREYSQGVIKSFEVVDVKHACQGSCRPIHAASAPFTGAAACSPATSLRSGFSVTTFSGVQFLVAPDQRCGLRSRARWYTSCRAARMSPSNPAWRCAGLT